MPSLPDFFLQNPVARSFKVTSHFNDPRNYTFAPNKLQRHEGIDIAAVDAQGQPVAVFAAQRGVVDSVGFSPQGYGNYVQITHSWRDDTWVTWYGHLSQVTVQTGQFVMAGQKIGVAGTTGFSTGVHLHLTLQHIGHGLANYTVDDVVDPEPFCISNPVSFDEASFVADVTIPDGMVVQAGQPFEKIWRIRNTGTTTWGANYQFVFAGEESMGGPEGIPLPVLSVSPGQVIELSVPLVAPTSAGRHRCLWQLRAPDGTLCDQKLDTTIVIKVVEPFDEASYVADVTIEDGTVIQPGEQFTKTWRIRNSGTKPWDQSYSLAFFAHNSMNGPASIPLTRKVKPGEVIELSVTLTAPKTPGRHRSTWKMRSPDGLFFEYEQYAEILVPRPMKPKTQLNEARFVADVTFPDETVVQPGQRFVKTWRIRNTGTTTWGEGYRLAFFSDSKMGGPNSVPLPPANPGDTVEVSVPLVAPARSGLHRSTWKPHDPKGNFFDFDLFTLIKVAADPQFDEASWVADISIADGTTLKPGEIFVKTWRIRNTGTTTWGPGYRLAFFGDDRMGGPDSIPLPAAKPGESAEISVTLTAPDTPGLHKSTWKGRTSQGKFFEYDLFALIDVVDPNQTYDMLAFLQGDGRLYELECHWTGGGRQRVQTQVQQDRFYHVKNSEWEELWADDRFIYRGTDTSLGGGEVYTLTENGQYGSPWIPRRMMVGLPFRRMPLVIFRRKSDGTELRHFTHVTWIRLEAVHPRLKLASGIELPDVAVLAAFEDASGNPTDQPFARYFYARHYGLVAWEGSLGQSCICAEFPAGTQPDNQREVLGWLQS